MNIHDFSISANFNRAPYTTVLDTATTDLDRAGVNIDGIPPWIEELKTGGLKQEVLDFVNDNLITAIRDGLSSATMYSYPVIQSETAALQGGYIDTTYGQSGDPNPNPGWACDSAHWVNPSDTPNDKGCMFIQNNVDLKKSYSKLTGRIKIMGKKVPNQPSSATCAILKLPPAPGTTQETWIKITSGMLAHDYQWYTPTVPYTPGDRHELPWIKALVNLNRDSADKRFGCSWVKVDYMHLYQ